MQSLAGWVASTRMSAFVTDHTWVWPTCETLHFIGLALLVGNVGLTDLRLLGVEKSLPLRPLSRFIGWAVAGFLVNLATGIIFFVGNPAQYVNNVAFHYKIVFIVLAGVNVLLFYWTGVSRKVALLAPGEDAPASAKVVAAVSLFLWIAVMYMGRMLPYIGNSF
jgi:hypothetical protein